MLSEKQITKFQTLYKNRFGVAISREQAYEKGIKLIRLVKLIYKPITEKDCQELQKRRKKIKKDLF